MIDATTALSDFPATPRSWPSGCPVSTPVRPAAAGVRCKAAAVQSAEVSGFLNPARVFPRDEALSRAIGGSSHQRRVRVVVPGLSRP